VDRVKGWLSEQVVVTLRLCRECSIAEIMKVHSDKLQRCLHAEKKNTWYHLLVATAHS